MSSKTLTTSSHSHALTAPARVGGPSKECPISCMLPKIPGMISVDDCSDQCDFSKYTKATSFDVALMDDWTADILKNACVAIPENTGAKEPTFRYEPLLQAPKKELLDQLNFFKAKIYRSH